MLRVGLTGGMGSGKTTVAAIFEILGVPVYYADDAAKRLINEDPSIFKKIVQAFGKEAYSNKRYNHTYIREIVFADPSKLDILNKIVHPATLEDAKKWLNSRTEPYAIKEAALIFEAGAEKDLDFVIGVESPLTLRIQRIQNRDNLPEKEITSRISRQMDEETKMKLCDFIILNDEKQLLIPQVINLHEKLLKLALDTVKH